MVAGAMLGIGIFIFPPVVAEHVSGPLYFFAMWIVGGLAALCGALSVAELGAMMPRAGGDYPYLQEAYGPGVAFAAGWLQMLATFPGSLATMAVGAAAYQVPVLLGGDPVATTSLGPLELDATRMWALMIVLALTALNHIGVIVSGRTQLVLTMVPLALFFVVSLIVVGGVGPEQLGAIHPGEPPTVDGIARAYLPVYFAYSGWNAAIYIGGEIRDPGRTLPRAVIGGTLTVLILYMVLCAGFLSVFPIDKLAEVGEAGTAAATEIFGSTGKITVTVLILLAMLGSINGTVLTGSRVGFAMARGGDFLRQAARLHPRFGTPVIALWVQAAIAVVLIMTNSFEELLDYTSCAMLITGSLTVMSVLVLRRRKPRLARPYRVGLYPLPPLLYTASSLFVLIVLIGRGDPSVFAAVLWFGLAMLTHRLVRGRERR
ncbi:MAG: amino acid permease [Myxococcales bacterium]|nr:amino acid permease [Myxococcales bacterium]